MEAAGVEPASKAEPCRIQIAPEIRRPHHDDGASNALTGFEPARPGFRSVALPLSYSALPAVHEEPSRSTAATIDWVVQTQQVSGLGT